MHEGQQVNLTLLGCCWKGLSALDLLGLAAESSCALAELSISDSAACILTALRVTRVASRSSVTVSKMIMSQSGTTGLINTPATLNTFFAMLKEAAFDLWFIMVEICHEGWTICSHKQFHEQ